MREYERLSAAPQVNPASVEGDLRESVSVRNVLAAVFLGEHAVVKPRALEGTRGSQVAAGVVFGPYSNGTDRIVGVLKLGKQSYYVETHESLALPSIPHEHTSDCRKFTIGKGGRGNFSTLPIAPELGLDHQQVLIKDTLEIVPLLTDKVSQVLSNEHVRDLFHNESEVIADLLRSLRGKTPLFSDPLLHETFKQMLLRK